MITQALQMIDDFLNDKYDPLKFSYDFPDFLIDKYEVMEKENKTVNDILNEDMPEICAEYELGANPEEFKRKVKEEYERSLNHMRRTK